MKKRVLRSSDALHEAYMSGLRKAHRIISRIISESTGSLSEYVRSLPLEKIALHLKTPKKDAMGNVVRSQFVPVNPRIVADVVETLVTEEGVDVTSWSVDDIVNFLEARVYYEDLFDYNSCNETDYADDDELVRNVSVIWLNDGVDGMLAK